MKRFGAVLVLGVACTLGAGASSTHQARETARLRYRPECILGAVATRMGVPLREEVALPPVFFESETPLEQFQDAIEPQWGLRPHVFVNAYVVARNEIYLIDELAYYASKKRSIDDSLAHEFVHYLQVKYQGVVLDDDFSIEAEAIDVQTWFRETFIHSTLPAGYCQGG